MTILVQPPAVCFSSGFGDIKLQLAAGESSVAVKVLFGATEVLSESYVPDALLQVTISDLGDVLVNWLREVRGSGVLLSQQTNWADFTVQLTTTATTSFTTRVIACVPELSATASDFINARFLTLCFGEKITALGRTEIVAFYTTESSPANCTISLRYKHNTTGAIYNTTSSRALVGTGNVRLVNVSPGLFSLANYTLVYYAAVHGARVQKFAVDGRPALHARHFVFRNAFGVEETFTCVGIQESETKVDRSFGYASGKYRSFRNNPVKEFTVNTGVLTQAQADWIEDLFSSSEVAVYTSAGVVVPVTILSESVKRSSAPDELPAFEFKYRIQIDKPRFEVPASGGVFDDTFDYTFS